MGRKNKRKNSAYYRKLRMNPKRLVSRETQPGRRTEVELEHTQEVNQAQTETPQHTRIPLRGEIWFAEFGTHPGTSVQEGCRPAFIMSNDIGNLYSDILSVIPLTSKMKKRHLPTHVSLSDVDCPNLEPSMALAEQLTTIGKGALKNYVGTVNASKVCEIEKAVEMQLGLEPRFGSDVVLSHSICEGV